MMAFNRVLNIVILAICIFFCIIAFTRWAVIHLIIVILTYVCFDCHLLDNYNGTKCITTQLAFIFLSQHHSVLYKFC